MDSAVERFVTHLMAAKNASPYTVRNYRREVGEALAYFQRDGARQWSDLDRGRLHRYLAWLVERGISRTSIARRVSELRSFGAFLVANGLAGANPFAGLKSPQVPSRLPSVLSPAEAGVLVAAPPDDSPLGLRDRAILEVLYGGGLRVSELVGLDVAHVSLAAKTVRVRGKGDRERVALLGDFALAALRRYLATGRPALAVAAAENGAPLFLNRRGARLTARSVQRLLVRHAGALGLGEDVTPHTLRHTFATHLMDGGADLRVVQELLGHRKLATTQVYTHVSQSQLRASYLAAHPRSGRAEPGSPTDE
jgi:integrase/recombinase XerC